MVSVLTCTGEEEHYLISTRNPFPDEGFRDLTQSVQVNSGTLPHTLGYGHSLVFLCSIESGLLRVFLKKKNKNE